MKKAAAGLLSVLAVLSIGFQAPVEAQGTPGGDALSQAGAKVRDAMLTGTHNELFNALAPWLRGRADLFKERLPGVYEELVAELPEEQRAELLNELRKDTLRYVKNADPDNKLGVESWDDFLALGSSGMLAVDLDQLVIQADDEIADNRAADWHEIDRAIYTSEDEVFWKKGDNTVTRTFGEVVYANRFLDSITVTCVAEGDAWQVVGFSGSIGEREFELEDSELMEHPLKEVIAVNVNDAKRAEGEQLMGVAKNQMRVEYSKTGTAPKALSDYDMLEQFEGMYFRIRDKVYKKPDMERGAVVAEPVDDDDLGWGAMYFDYATGESEIEWYASEEELDEALKSFQTAK